MTNITIARIIDDGRLRLADQMPDGSTIRERLNAFCLGLLNELAAEAGLAPIAMPDFGEGEGDKFTIEATNGTTRLSLAENVAEAALLVDLSDFEQVSTADPVPPAPEA